MEIGKSLHTDVLYTETGVFLVGKMESLVIVYNQFIDLVFFWVSFSALRFVPLQGVPDISPFKCAKCATSNTPIDWRRKDMTTNSNVTPAKICGKNHKCLQVLCGTAATRAKVVAAVKRKRSL